MLRDLYDTLRIRYAVWRYHRNRDRAYTRLTDAEQAGLDTLHGLNADTQARLRHAALLEANDVPEELVHVACRISSSGRFTTADINQIANQGIALSFGGGHYDKAHTSAKTHRLQEAVRRLAFIAGPGFTTDHLIDEGLIHEGDL